MELKTKDGNLKMASAYRLIVTAWMLSWGTFAGVIIVLLILITLLTGEMTVNGELVQGRAEALTSMIPIIVLFPIIIIFHAFVFGGFLLFGLWIYKFKKPLRVVSED